MNQLSLSLNRIRFVILALLCALCFVGHSQAEELPNLDVLRDKKPLTQAQMEKAQWAQIMRRAADVENRGRKIVNVLVVMFLFGAFCALWAQNTGRNFYLWFLTGFIFTVFAVVAILRINPRPKRRKKRYRRILDYWTLAHFS